MDEIYFYSYHFLPLIEITFDGELREELEFLKNGLSTVKELEKRIQTKKNLQSKQSQSFFQKYYNIYFQKYSNLYWAWSSDGYFYYRNAKHLFFDQQPIRPLLPLVTNSLKWKSIAIQNKYLEAKKRVELYPFLIATITKKVMFNARKFDKKSIFNDLNILILQSQKEANGDKLSILSGVFEDYKHINIPLSDQIIVIEIDEEKRYSIFTDLERKKAIVVGNVIIYWKSNNQILLIYKAKSSKSFRKRIREAVKLAFSLKILQKRVQYLLNKDIFKELNVSTKIALLEYILSALNPWHYSSKIRINLLPKHYQRIVFTKVYQKITGEEIFEQLFNKIKAIVLSWESYEQNALLRQNNIFINQFKEEIQVDNDDFDIPSLSLKAELMLNFLLDYYKKQLSEVGFENLKIISKYSIGSITTNQIRVQIRDWIKTNKIDNVNITDSELKEIPSNVIKELMRKDLVIAFKPQAGRPKSYFAVNDKNPYIKNKLWT